MVPLHINMDLNQTIVSFCDHKPWLFYGACAKGGSPFPTQAGARRRVAELRNCPRFANKIPRALSVAGQVIRGL